jgi:hypothetical protein
MVQSVDSQIARSLYLPFLSAMKEVLRLGEFKIGGRESRDYRFFRRIVMDQFYEPLQEAFSRMEEQGILEKCPCGTNVRRGYQDCRFCNGAGYRNTKQTDEFILKEQSCQS